MRLTSIEIRPDNSSDSIVLSFRNPSSNNMYSIKSITGLDAESIITRHYGGGSGGSAFHDLSVEKREIVMKIGLNPLFEERQSYSELRDALYRSISSTRTGKIQLHMINDDGLFVTTMAVTSGFVTKFESPHFERLQEVILTITCDSGFLRAPERLDESLVGLSRVNALITDDKSTAPHGFIFGMNITSSISSIIISDPNDASWSFGIAPFGGFINGDLLNFSSEYNNKYVSMVRAGNTIPLAEAIIQGSVWPIMFPGDNHFSFTNDAYLAWESFSYYPTYWGV